MTKKSVRVYLDEKTHNKLLKEHINSGDSMSRIVRESLKKTIEQMDGNYTYIEQDGKHYLKEVNGYNVFRIQFKQRKNVIASPLYLVANSGAYISSLYPIKPKQSLEPKNLKGSYRMDYSKVNYYLNVDGENVSITRR